MNFQDIPQFPRAHYEVTVDWSGLEYHLARYIREYRLNLDPDFQRAHVWTDDQQIKYIEYVLQGGEVGRVITFNAPNWNNKGTVGQMELVDGKQRLEAVRAFMRNEFPVFGNIYCRDIENVEYHVSFLFRVCSINKREDILRLYLNINAGGTPHTKKELDKVRNMLTEERLRNHIAEQLKVPAEGAVIRHTFEPSPKDGNICIAGKNPHQNRTPCGFERKYHKN